MSECMKTQDDGPEEGEIEDDDDDETSLSFCESLKVREGSSSSSSLDRDIRNHELQRAIRKQISQDLARSSRSLGMTVDNERMPSRATYNKRDRTRSRANYPENDHHKTSRSGLTHGKENRHVYQSADDTNHDSHSKALPLHHSGRQRSLSPARRAQCREHSEAHHSTSKRHRSLSDNASSKSSDGTERETAPPPAKKKRNRRRIRRRSKVRSELQEKAAKRTKNAHDVNRRVTEDMRITVASGADSISGENTLKEKLVKMGALSKQTQSSKEVATNPVDQNLSEKSKSPLPSIPTEESSENAVVPEKLNIQNSVIDEIDADNGVIFVASVSKPQPELVTLTDSDAEQENNQDKVRESLDITKGAADMDMSQSSTSSNIEMDPVEPEIITVSPNSADKPAQSSAMPVDQDDDDIISLRQAALLSKNKSTTETARSTEQEEDDLQLRVLALKSAVMRKAMDRKKRKQLAGASRLHGDEVTPVDMELADTDDEEETPPPTISLPPPPMPSELLLQALTNSVGIMLPPSPEIPVPPEDGPAPVRTAHLPPPEYPHQTPLEFQQITCPTQFPGAMPSQEYPPHVDYPVIHPVHPVPYPGMPPEYPVNMEYPVVGAEYQSQIPDAAHSVGYREASVPVPFQDTTVATMPYQEAPEANLLQEEYLPEEWRPDEPEVSLPAVTPRKKLNARPNLREISLTRSPAVTKEPAGEDVQSLDLSSMLILDEVGPSPSPSTQEIPQESPLGKKDTAQEKQTVPDEDEIALREKLLKAISSKRETRSLPKISLVLQPPLAPPASLPPPAPLPPPVPLAPPKAVATKERLVFSKADSIKVVVPAQPRAPSHPVSRKVERPKSKPIPVVPRVVIHLGEDSDSSDSLDGEELEEAGVQKQQPWQQTNLYQMKDYCPRTSVTERAEGLSAKLKGPGQEEETTTFASPAAGTVCSELMPDFESKLDRFLKDARSSQEAAAPSSSAFSSTPVAAAIGAAPESPVVSQAPVSKVVLHTPQVVRHLPAPMQEEYRKLKQMYAEREFRKKAQKVAAISKRPPGKETEIERPQNRAENSQTTKATLPSGRLAPPPRKLLGAGPAKKAPQSVRPQLTAKASSGTPTTTTSAPPPPPPLVAPLSSIPQRPEVSSADMLAPQVQTHKALWSPLTRDFFRGAPVKYAPNDATDSSKVSAARLALTGQSNKDFRQVGVASQLEQFETNLLKERSNVMGQVMALTRLQQETEEAMSTQDMVESTLLQAIEHLHAVCERWSDRSQKVHDLAKSVIKKRESLKQSYARTEALNKRCRALGFQLKGANYTPPGGSLVQSKQRAADQQFSRILRWRKMELRRVRSFVLKADSSVRILQKALPLPNIPNPPITAANTLGAALPVPSIPSIPPVSAAPPVSAVPTIPRVLPVLRVAVEPSKPSSVPSQPEPKSKPPTATDISVTKPSAVEVPGSTDQKDRNSIGRRKMRLQQDEETVPSKEASAAEGLETKRTPSVSCARRLIRVATRRLRHGAKPRESCTAPRKAVLGAEEERPAPQNKHVLSSYKSPLDHLGIVRNPGGLVSRDAILFPFDPDAILCPYDLNGKCEDDECKFQHQAKDLSKQS